MKLIACMLLCLSVSGCVLFPPHGGGGGGPGGGGGGGGPAHFAPAQH
ncbi:hypothetical protein [Celerinatantimonas sp. MCCC 1A17872]